MPPKKRDLVRVDVLLPRWLSDAIKESADIKQITSTQVVTQVISGYFNQKVDLEIARTAITKAITLQDVDDKLEEDPDDNFRHFDLEKEWNRLK